LKSACIICTTLSTGGGNVAGKCLQDQIDFLIIDETCQSSELTTLMPFVLNPKRVIFVGDHKQLPATIFSDNKDETLFGRSLFERLIEGGKISLHF